MIIIIIIIIVIKFAKGKTRSAIREDYGVKSFVGVGISSFIYHN